MSWRRRDASNSPSARRTAACTPQKSFPTQIPSYDSLMLTPSPLKPRSQFTAANWDDGFFDSPYRSPTLAYSARPEAMRDENERVVPFNLTPDSPTPTDTFTSFMPSSSSTALYTPVKPSQSTFDEDMSSSPIASSGLGTKRKSSSILTPLRQHKLTPLSISREHSFPKLDPLPRPLFYTPRASGNSDHTDTMGKLTLSDLDDDDDLVARPKKFAKARKSEPAVLRGPSDPPKHALNRSWGSKGDSQDLSTANIAGKRRARARPVPARDKREQVKQQTSVSPRKRTQLQRPAKSQAPPQKPSSKPTFVTPALPPPGPRRRPVNAVKSGIPVLASPRDPSLSAPRRPMQRNESAATLFFGPKIESGRTRTTSDATESPKREQLPRPKMSSRHSYAGGDPWASIPSARFSPELPPSHTAPSQHPDSDEEMFDLVGNTSFQFSVTSGTPSPKRTEGTTPLIVSKYKPPGIGTSDDEDDHSFRGYTIGRSASMNLMPTSSSSTSSISDNDDELVTPGVGPTLGSGWPIALFSSNGSLGPTQSRADEDIEGFIKRTLAGTRQSHSSVLKKAPGTPVKKTRTFLPVERPWQSAVADRVARGPVFQPKKAKAPPRKSMPANFGRRAGSLLDDGSDTEEEEDIESPSFKKGRYPALGIGRPSPRTPETRKDHASIHRTKFLMRRSSSGAFSSSSESTSSFATPTRQTARVSVLSPRSNSSSSSLTTGNTLFSPSRLHCQSSDLSFDQARLGQEQLWKDDESGRGRFVRDFVPIDEVGSGEFGQVIKVKAKADDVVYAVKISKNLEGPRHRLRLAEELQVLKHLSQTAQSQGLESHPNVLRFVDGWEEDDKLYIRTELCELGNFSTFLCAYGRNYPRLDESRVWKIMAALCNGLKFIHEAGIIHLDLKPANIFITAHGQFKIGDFGMASVWPRPIPAELTSEPGLLPEAFEREGDKLYLAAEVLRGQYGQEADVFSIGMTMLETAYNIVVPGQGEAWHLLRQDDFSQINDTSGDEALFTLIQMMMKADPASRPSAKEVCEHPIVLAAMHAMDEALKNARAGDGDLFAASPLGRCTFERDIGQDKRGQEDEDDAMDIEV